MARGVKEDIRKPVESWMGGVEFRRDEGQFVIQLGALSVRQPGLFAPSLVFSTDTIP